MVWGAVLILGLLPSADAVEEWSDFRGPGGQGHSAATGLPVEWSPTQNVVWKRPVPGLGWSSPVVSGGRIYLTSAVPVSPDQPNLSLRTLAFDAATGDSLWDVEVFLQEGEKAPKIHGKNSHASPTVVVRGERLFVHFGHQGTACLNRQGEVLWRNRELSYAPVHGNGGTPALVDQLVVFSADGASDPFLAALDQSTGAVRWKTVRVSDAPKKFSFSTPLVIEVDGQRQIISPGSNSVGAFDPRTGHELWRVRYTGYSVIPRPVFAGGLLLIGTGYDSPTVMAIRPGGSGDVTDTHVAWTVKKGAPHTPSLLAVDDRLYMVSDRGVASCLELQTGQEVWQERLGGNYSASPLYAEGRIYFQSEEGVATVVRAGPSFELLAKNDLAERTLASYGVDGRALLIRTAGHLYRIAQPQ
ncbi:MAG: PQQ-binding-like beta-propeller repeat protein [Pirellulales bacterium]